MPAVLREELMGIPCILLWPAGAGWNHHPGQQSKLNINSCIHGWALEHKLLKHKGFLWERWTVAPHECGNRLWSLHGKSQLFSVPVCMVHAELDILFTVIFFFLNLVVFLMLTEAILVHSNTEHWHSGFSLMGFNNRKMEISAVSQPHLTALKLCLPLLKTTKIPLNVLISAILPNAHSVITFVLFNRRIFGLSSFLLSQWSSREKLDFVSSMVSTEKHAKRFLKLCFKCHLTEQGKREWVFFRKSHEATCHLKLFCWRYF